METITMLAPIISNGARSGTKRKGLVGITIHDTGNTAVGAGAKNHGSYLQNGGKGKQVSWHYAVDKDCAVQSIPEDEVAWHAGDGVGNGNYKTIAIEICINSDGDIVAATNNAAQLAANLLSKYDLTVDNLYQHNHWSGKNCPAQIRRGNPYNWGAFKAKVSECMGTNTNTSDSDQTTNTGNPSDFNVGDTIAIQYPNGAYIADGNEKYAGIWQVVEYVLAGGKDRYKIKDNGIPMAFLDRVDVHGNKTPNSDNELINTNDYFVFNRNLKVVETTVFNNKLYLRLDGNGNADYRFWAVASRCQKI